VKAFQVDKEVVDNIKYIYMHAKKKKKKKKKEKRMVYTLDFANV
jgi:hypothetical protein